MPQGGGVVGGYGGGVGGGQHGGGMNMGMSGAGVVHMPSMQGVPEGGAAFGGMYGRSGGFGGSHASAFGGPQLSAFGGSQMSAIGVLGDAGRGAVYVGLEIRALGLKDKDWIGKSDPMCTVYQMREGGAGGHATVNKWVPVGRTEVVENNTSPSWVKRIRIVYRFEMHQPILFEVVDVDNRKTLKGNRLGRSEVTLAEVVRNGMLRMKLTSEKGRGNWGELIVRAHDEGLGSKVRLKLSLGGKGLDKKDHFFGKSDPYYIIKQVLDAGKGGTTTVFKSAMIRNTCDPTWEPHTLKISAGQGVRDWNDIHMVATVFDWDKLTPHDLIGEASFTLQQLTSTPYFELINPKKVSKSRYKNSGQLVVHRAEAANLPSFVSYLQGGMKLDFIVAVDFTSSNRPVDNPNSLHYVNDPQRPSQYAQALHAVGTILSAYIPDGLMTALGFGAVLPGQGNTPCFDFALTGQPDARVPGVEGLLAAYEHAVRNVTLAGPTNFTPLIRNAMRVSSAVPVSQLSQHFSILLILTDGIISDLPSTIDAIIESSYNTPMAIVIVGIGDANFDSMKRLDGDDHSLRSDSGRQAKYDIVQFAKFDPSKSIETLAAEVLHEIPDYVVEFMVDAGIMPNPPML